MVLALRITTNVYPKEQRRDAWRFALKRLSLTLDEVDEATLYGELIHFRSSTNIDFTRVTGTPQSWSIDFREQPQTYWLAIILDGSATMRDAQQEIRLGDGEMICGRGDSPVHLSFAGDNRSLIVQVPHSELSMRLKTPIGGAPRKIATDTGTARVFAGMLRSLADTISDITTDQARPIELAFPEFLVTSLLDNAPAKALGGAAGMRAALLERIFQTIEIRLSDPDLNYQQVAAEHGISPRYLQKLFESINDSFGHYVKVRRLERCRLDLRSPLHVQKSISDILFEWGFNDSASFSRAFREQYGISPREYRKAQPQEQEAVELLRRGRPARGERSAAKQDSSGEEKLVDAAEEPDPRREPDKDADGEEEGASAPALDAAQFLPDGQPVRHHHLPASPETVHWGYLSKDLKPALHVRSGDFITIETLTHHANDDPERMVHGDPGAESVYHWDEHGKAVDRRGAGPMDASAFGRGPGEGFGVHICTGPIAIEGAMPGDLVEVRILDLKPRPSGNPRFAGKCFGSNAATYWGFHYQDLLTEPKKREVITIYEVEATGARTPTAHAVYQYRWTEQVDPSGIAHSRYDYPGVPVDPTTIERNYDVLRNVEIPIRPHFGVIAVAPAYGGLVDSVPPASFGGNLDNWRTGPGARVFLPVQVAGALLSLGDPHASQGDSELCGTAIECSMTGLIQVVHHKASGLIEQLKDVDYPLIETETEWVVMGFSHPDYLKELGEDAQSEVYKQSSIDSAMRDAFRKARRFLMTAKQLSEDEAISLLSVGVDFGVSQVVNGNFGVHAVIRKALFTS
ncbi:AraC family transcriptional regulator [Novosphingobium pentaromativorans US6-1]|uniref:Transcriptional regulator, AraC family with acetamidase/formamidase activity n=1 Tax=Novosphingobium pentaromativorans US6-1 TaxID=1088721 RepID=G6EEE5_9SPHN|nr:AraC family transcriptional regulator [Novosphingobium pentaromativorans US6-1]EHJ60368.1 transcriptional regulator, AraC family with acetamidase/formamidase activity [Novosphingobium pentaromativorans US6-1]